MAPRTIVIAGGGTGGHLYPGIAIAQELQRRRELEIVFAGAGLPLERSIVERHGFRLMPISSGGVVGKSIGGRVRGLARASGGFIDALRRLRRMKPDAVIGVGGYASGPTVAAAILLRLPTMIQEQNYYPGLTNRLLAPWVTRVAISFEETRRLLGGRGELTGNPIRAEFHRARRTERADRFRVMVFGGSQGSRAINAAVIDALATLEPQRSALRFVHGTGVSDHERVRAAYAGRGYDAEVVPYITDIRRAYEEADLVVARAGASSVSELAACGKAAILIPLPTAAHDHQRFNARKVADAGAAVLLEEKNLSGPRLAAAIEELMHTPERIASMERAAAGLAHPEAAGRIAAMVGEIAAW